MNDPARVTPTAVQASTAHPRRRHRAPRPRADRRNWCSTSAISAASGRTAGSADRQRSIARATTTGTAGARSRTRGVGPVNRVSISAAAADVSPGLGGSAGSRPVNNWNTVAPKAYTSAFAVDSPAGRTPSASARNNSGAMYGSVPPGSPAGWSPATDRLKSIRYGRPPGPSTTLDGFRSPCATPDRCR